jgi:hypothetical protein
MKENAETFFEGPLPILLHACFEGLVSLAYCVGSHCQCSWCVCRPIVLPKRGNVPAFFPLVMARHRPPFTFCSFFFRSTAKEETDTHTHTHTHTHPHTHTHTHTHTFNPLNSPLPKTQSTAQHVVLRQ